MSFPRLLLPLALLALIGCDPSGGGGGSPSVRISGDAAVGISSNGSGDIVYGGGLGGPPPGRTEAERQARRQYYRGPRGREF